MKVVKVIPLVPNVPREHLSYFTAREVEAGMIVSVPLRKKTVDALVIQAEEATIEKTELKKASFNVKKVLAVKGDPFWKKEFTAAAEKTATYFASTLGATLSALIPAPLLKQYSKINSGKKKESADVNSVALKIKSEKLAFQGSYEDRISFYKTYIRESFAKKRSVFLLLPTIRDIELFAETLRKGIEEYTFVLHSELSPKKILDTFNSAVKEAHPSLIIATGSYICLPREDLGTIIVEQESKSAYTILSRPYIDLRIFAEIYAYMLGVKFIMADSAMRPETIQRTESGELGEVAPLSFRVPRAPGEEIVSMLAATTTEKRKAFSILSDRSYEELQESVTHGGQSFVFALRKGLAPVTLCNDCGTTLACDYCTTPLVLYPGERSGDRIYICNKCKREKTSKTVCKNCGSWNLSALGVGATGVAEEIARRMPDVPIFLLTKDHAKTPAEAERIVKQFEKTPGSILVGTEYALFYVKEKVRTVIVASFDSFFSIPSFRINEKIIQLVIMLRSLTLQSLLIQTKNPEQSVLEAVEGGNLINLYREEIRERRELGYPPFATIFKITCKGDEAEIDEQQKKIHGIFADYHPDTFDAFVKRINNTYVSHTIIKIDPSFWTIPELATGGTLDTVLLAKLRSLPPFITVHVNPEDLL